MQNGLDIAFFGSSLVSAYWNGAATYYRGLIHALHERGHRIRFFEPDAYDRQAHRDIADPDWASVVVYAADNSNGVEQAMEQARGADIIVKASGVGVFDTLLEQAIPAMARPHTVCAFWDVDAPATLERMRADPHDPLRGLVPRYDLILTYGGGDAVVDGYQRFGARRCVPIYNAVDPDTHYPVAPDPRFRATLGFLGNRLPDRETRVDQFFMNAAARLPRKRFLLGGSGWADKPLPRNVRYAGHVYTRDHNAFNSTPLAVINITRDSMARYGYSPPTRVFEAAGAAACLITDDWEGVEAFLEPGREVLVAQDGAQVAELLFTLRREDARAIGAAARKRVLREHTYAQRARQAEAVLEGLKEG
ncbi:MAG: glycosyltransferase [Aquisalimonadaceae bacterium]